MARALTGSQVSPPSASVEADQGDFGSVLHGPAGAFVAVPVAAAIQVILNNTLAPALEEPTLRVPVPESELDGDRVAPAEALASPPR